jgi:hypothetical protein
MLNEVVSIQWRQREQEIRNMNGSHLLYGLCQLAFMDYRRDNAEASQALKQMQKDRDRQAYLQKLKTDRKITLTSQRIERKARKVGYVPAWVGSMHSFFKDDILMRASLIREHQKETDVLHRTRMQMIIGTPLPLSAMDGKMVEVVHRTMDLLDKKIKQENEELQRRIAWAYIAYKNRQHDRRDQRKDQTNRATFPNVLLGTSEDDANKKNTKTNQKTKGQSCEHERANLRAECKTKKAAQRAKMTAEAKHQQNARDADRARVRRRTL